MSDGNIRIIEMPAADAVEDNDFLAIDNNSVAQSNDDTTAGTRKVRAKDFVQASLTVDETPTEDSENLVTSGGVYDAVDGLNDKITSMEIIGTASGEIATFDDGSANPIKELTAQIEPVQSGSGDPSPINICPISGWTGANVEVDGANLWDEEWELGGVNATTGENQPRTDRIRSENYISVKPSTTYYIKMPSNGLWLYWYDKNKTFAERQSRYAGYTFTTPSNCYFIRFETYSEYGTTYNNDISINYPSTDTSYHAYNGNTYPISWSDEAGTVYGGNFKVFKDGGKWYITVNSCPYFASYNGETLVGEWISDRDVYAVGTTPTIGAQVVNIGGEVTTTTFEISTEIATLLGNNNIFADCGDVDVTYQRDLNIVINKLLQG